MLTGAAAQGACRPARRKAPETQPSTPTLQLGGGQQLGGGRWLLLLGAARPRAQPRRSGAADAGPKEATTGKPSSSSAVPFPTYTLWVQLNGGCASTVHVHMHPPHRCRLPLLAQQPRAWRRLPALRAALGCSQAELSVCMYVRSAWDPQPTMPALTMQHRTPASSGPSCAATKRTVPGPCLVLQHLRSAPRGIRSASQTPAAHAREDQAASS
jgi:hypothetical protein